MIRIPQVRVIDEENAQLGVMPTPQALEMAQERGLDLVEVAPLASPPVVKFLDFGQYKYELTKREKEAKRKQRSVTFKEVRLSPKIGVGDFDTKVHRAIEFLEDGDRIKVTVRFRGRELTHPEIGRNLIARFSDRVKDHGVPERVPLLEGKSMYITMASTHKPKSARGTGQAGRPRRRPKAPPSRRRSRHQPHAAAPAAPAAKAEPAPERSPRRRNRRPNRPTGGRTEDRSRRPSRPPRPQPDAKAEPAAKAEPKTEAKPAAAPRAATRPAPPRRRPGRPKKRRRRRPRQESKATCPRSRATRPPRSASA